jgi:hypothetical protein
VAKYPSSDGMLRVQLVAVIANIAAPTVAELGVGTHITSFVTKDGLTVPSDQNNVDVGSAAENYNAQVPGTFGGAVEITGMRDNAADTLWDLITYNLARFIVVRRGIATAAAFAAAQKVEVYPATFHEPVPDQTGGDEVARFTLSAPCWARPEMKAVVAA